MPREAKIMIILTIRFSHRDVILSPLELGEGDRTGSPSPISQMNAQKPRKAEYLIQDPEPASDVLRPSHTEGMNY